MADEKKGITVKIDADLHAEIREYLERHEGMTMAEFITLAVDDELHPKIDFESEAARDITYTFTVENEKLLLVSAEKDKEITYELTKTNDG